MGHDKLELPCGLLRGIFSHACCVYQVRERVLLSPVTTIILIFLFSAICSRRDRVQGSCTAYFHSMCQRMSPRSAAFFSLHGKRSGFCSRDTCTIKPQNQRSAAPLDRDLREYLYLTLVSLNLAVNRRWPANGTCPHRRNLIAHPCFGAIPSSYRTLPHQRPKLLSLVLDLDQLCPRPSCNSP